MVGPRTKKSTLLRAALACGIAVGAFAIAGCAEAEAPPAEAAEAPEGAVIDSLKIIVPADPGGGWDQTGRAIQQALQEAKLVGTAQVVNVPGAGGTSGLASLATEKEPNTIMVTGLVMVGAVETNKSSNRIEDTTPIAKLTEEPLVIVVPAESAYQDIGDLVDAMVAEGQAISIAGGSAGGADNILAGQLLAAAGVPGDEIVDKLNYVAFSGGGESLAALLGNKVSAGISGVGEYAEQVTAGALRALAVSGPERSEALPDTPTLIESGYDVELTNWRGVLASGSIDEKTAGALIEVISTMQGADQWQKILADNNWADAFMAGAEFQEFLTADIASVTETLKGLGLVK